MVENIRDALAYLLLGSLAPVLFYVMGDVNHSIWPLVAWIFGLIVFVGVFEGPPQPVRHDLGMPARTLGHVASLDKYMREVHARAAADGMFRDRNSHERLGDREAA